jgi:hypothetical protein
VNLWCCVGARHRGEHACEGGVVPGQLHGERSRKMLKQMFDAKFLPSTGDLTAAIGMVRCSACIGLHHTRIHCTLHHTNRYRAIYTNCAITFMSHCLLH